MIFDADWSQGLIPEEIGSFLLDDYMIDIVITIFVVGIIVAVAYGLRTFVFRFDFDSNDSYSSISREETEIPLIINGSKIDESEPIKKDIIEFESPIKVSFTSFFCQMDQALHIDKNIRYQCEICNRFICEDCHDVGVTECPFCKGELVHQINDSLKGFDKYLKEQKNYQKEHGKYSLHNKPRS